MLIPIATIELSSRESATVRGVLCYDTEDLEIKCHDPRTGELTEDSECPKLDTAEQEINYIQDAWGHSEVWDLQWLCEDTYDYAGTGTLLPEGFDSIAALLDRGGVECTRNDRYTDRESIHVPGYGEICRDDRPGIEGYYARGYHGGADSPISDLELMHDLFDLGEEVRRECQGAA